jgi:hypothetical protein
MEVNGQLHARPRCPRGRAPVPMDRMLRGTQSRHGRGGEGKNLYHHPCRELNPGRPVRSLVSVPTELHPTFDSAILLLVRQRL